MVHLRDTGNLLRPDPSRLVTRAFLPGGPNFAGAAQRIGQIVARLEALSPEARRRLLELTRARAHGRYADIEARWEIHFLAAKALLDGLDGSSDEWRLLVGAALTQGYAYEAAALTNPSIVPIGPAHAGVQPFVMSARAIGEGHVSSIAFLSGRVDDRGSVVLDQREPFPSNGERRSAAHQRASFARKVAELGVHEEVASETLAGLAEVFTIEALDAALVKASLLEPGIASETLKIMHWVAASNYELRFDPSLPMSRRLISPAAPAESHGMEDARFVRFTEDDGAASFYATYTAFDGQRTLSQLIHTEDFARFHISTMSGPTAAHKGMALFPRRVGGDLLALSRHDNESIFVMRGDTMQDWGAAERVVRPELDWEAVQVGNCGSPLETEHGWLVITHGVGPMRRYVLGAVLLDLDDPSRVIGRLQDPLVEPLGDDTVGYVPDVVYSCGSMIHAGLLVIPYGFADHGIKVAVAEVAEIIAAMS